jgi:drug/metabolite transporter (DMT)-like permease
VARAHRVHRRPRRDLAWHASHEEFETASDQLLAHWLAWLGALILLAAAALVLAQRRGTLAVTAVLVGAAGYATVAVWHFYEHSQHRDPDAPHVLLAVTQIVMLAGVPFAALALPRHRSGAPEDLVADP